MTNENAIIVRGRQIINHRDGTYVIAEIGTNHNRDIATAREPARCAAAAGCDCVKFYDLRGT